jgi:hypothetical protein
MVMRRLIVPVIAIVALLSVRLLRTPLLPSAAQNGAPAASPAATPGAPAEMCSEEEILADDSIVRVPAHENEAAVIPHIGAPPGDKDLYLVVLTLPPGACLPYRYRTGAVVIVVQKGTILYQGHFTDAKVVKGDNDGDPADDVTVTTDTPIPLTAGEWITQDREMWFTFRNDGAGDAIVSVAVYANAWWLPRGGRGKGP